MFGAAIVNTSAIRQKKKKKKKNTLRHSPTLRPWSLFCARWFKSQQTPYILKINFNIILLFTTSKWSAFFISPHLILLYSLALIILKNTTTYFSPFPCYLSGGSRHSLWHPILKCLFLPSSFTVRDYASQSKKQKQSAKCLQPVIIPSPCLCTLFACYLQTTITDKITACRW